MTTPAPPAPPAPPIRLRVGNHWPIHLYELHPDGSQTPAGTALTPGLAHRIAAAANRDADRTEQEGRA